MVHLMVGHGRWPAFALMHAISSTPLRARGQMKMRIRDQQEMKVAQGMRAIFGLDFPGVE
jgi:hypothetical protein